jgi:hypothetical protein
MRYGVLGSVGEVKGVWSEIEGLTNVFNWPVAVLLG